MYLAAGHHFYASGTFWGVVAVVVSAVGVIATIWVTRLGASTKRRLYYCLLSDTPLLTRRQDLSEQLKVTYGDKKLDSPRVVILQLASRGRSDIAREAFDGAKPLILDLGTPIIELVKVTTSPSDRTDPECTVEGSELRVGPSHFGRRQTTEFSLLVDGEKPNIVPPKQTLLDVRIEHGDGQTIYQDRAVRTLIAAFIVVTIGGLASFAFDAPRAARVVIITAFAVIVGSSTLVAPISDLLSSVDRGIWMRKRR